MSDRRRVLAVVGNAGTIPEAAAGAARELGRRAIDAGFRLVTGGLGGVMAAASQGARGAGGYREGSIIGILPGLDRSAANEWVDIVIPTGMQLARNVLVVATADVVVALGGGSGTLSEIALAWQLGRPVIALRGTGGWADEVAGRSIDDRRDDLVRGADSPEKAIRMALEATATGARESGNVGSGWMKRP